eukprot:scaffold40361_cov221-Amphora_coffeaeformis.AAC.9
MRGIKSNRTTSRVGQTKRYFNVTSLTFRAGTKWKGRKTMGTLCSRRRSIVWTIRSPNPFG